MLLKDFLLTSLMEELSESVKDCSKIIRYGYDYSFINSKDKMTTEDLLSHSIANCQAIIILLNFLKIYITPTTSNHLINEGATINEMEYRIRNVFKFIKENNEYLDINLKELNNLEKIVDIEFKKAKTKMTMGVKSHEIARLSINFDDGRIF